MNTPELPPIAVDGITDKQVRAFLLGMCERLKSEIGENGLVMVRAEVSLYSSGTDEIGWTTYASGGSHETERTLEKAFNAQAAKMKPECLARSKREAADKLIEEAKKIEKDLASEAAA